MRQNGSRSVGPRAQPRRALSLSDSTAMATPPDAPAGRLAAADGASVMSMGAVAGEAKARGASDDDDAWRSGACVACPVGGGENIVREAVEMGSAVAGASGAWEEEAGDEEDEKERARAVASACGAWTPSAER